MSDFYDKQEDLLEQIAGNIIDVETAIGKTNELLGKILAVLEGDTEKLLHDTRIDLLNSLNAQVELKSRLEHITVKYVKEE